MKYIRLTFTLLVIALVGHSTTRAQDPLPSWNDGPAKQAIVDFVRRLTRPWLDPQRAVLIECGDAFLWRHKLRAGLIGDHCQVEVFLEVSSMGVVES